MNSLPFRSQIEPVELEFNDDEPNDFDAIVLEMERANEVRD